jgi:tetratricopeptide (TPR) repeat protein
MLPALTVTIIIALFLALRSEPLRLLRLVQRVSELRDRGKPDAAVELLQQALSKGRKSTRLVNLAVETSISAGKYSEALAMPTSFTPTGPMDEVNIVLVQINLAEAEYNLGSWAAAWDRLSRLDDSAAPFEITRAGLALQRAWILAHTNRPKEALSMWEQADMDGLPYKYRAEHYFTRVAVLLALEQIEDAEEAAAAGADAAVRMSSERNALFILARVAANRGDWERVDALSSAAAAHRYRGQGGDGLLLWGEVLSRLGRRTETRRAYELCIARDGQSESARKAAARLRAMDDASLK